MKNPSLDIIVTERCSTGGCPLEEACEHCYLIQSAISVAKLKKMSNFKLNSNFDWMKMKIGR
jgi:hypothetical protein